VFVNGDELWHDGRDHERTLPRHGGSSSRRDQRGIYVTEPEKTELAHKSDELLDLLHRLKDTEQRKRHEEISSDIFHGLANEVDAISREVFTVARDERDLGERTTRDGETIEDVESDDKSA
jgi:hypothetical protein